MLNGQPMIVYRRHYLGTLQKVMMDQTRHILMNQGLKDSGASGTATIHK